jgi:nucleotide-binding universal stress UspA family protein
MIEIKRILCPIDFSEHSRRALDHAAAVARWFDSEITLLHAYSDVPVAAYAPGAPMPPPALMLPADQEQVLAAMRRFAETEIGAGIPLRFELRAGVTSLEILAVADEIRADLLVIATHGRSGFQRLILGSVTEKVLRQATCPVLSVPGAAPDAVPAPPVLFKRILCATDFSESATRALNYALTLAKETDAHLTVLNVAEVPTDLAAGGAHAGEGSALNAYVDELYKERREHLSRAVPEDARTYCTVETLLTAGKPYREILRVAAERHAELIVMGVHGRSPADLLFFGSTTNHIVREAACPVLTLRTAP